MKNQRIVSAGALAAACLLAVSVLSSCGSPEGSRPDVVFVLLDALRPDHLGIYGYGGGTSPRLDEMARSGAVFRNHFANGTYTRASVPTYFYSRYYIKSLFPADRRLPLESPENLFRVLDPQALSLAALFKANGYHTVLFSAHPWFIRGHELVGDFDEFYRVSGAKSAHGEADEVVKRVEEWIAARGEDHRPYFLYIHMMDTHFPHVRRAETERFLEGVDPGEPERFDWRGYFRGQEMGKWGLWWLPGDFGPEDRRYLHALYDGDVAFSDFWVGRLVDFLQARGRADDTLFLITADHGEHLGDHGLAEHGGPPWD
nr:sulfatase [bacterium]